jgi:hypothetical protein
MPLPIHELLLCPISKEIQRQLSFIASHQDLSAEFAREIECQRSSTIHFDDSDYGRHDPDDSFAHSKTHYPGVVIEISYSQKRKDLARLADDYILGSDGSIRVVIGLDIEYLGKAALATLSVWQPRYFTNDDGEEKLQAEQTVINQVYSSATVTLYVLTITRCFVTKMAYRIQIPKQVYIFD